MIVVDIQFGWFPADLEAFILPGRDLKVFLVSQPIELLAAILKYAPLATIAIDVVPLSVDVEFIYDFLYVARPTGCAFRQDALR